MRLLRHELESLKEEARGRVGTSESLPRRNSSRAHHDMSESNNASRDSTTLSATNLNRSTKPSTTRFQPLEILVEPTLQLFSLSTQ
jgi:hypothetical protein